MTTPSRTRDRRARIAPALRPYTPRRERERRRVDRRLAIVALSIFAVAAALFTYLAPREQDKPLVTIYMHADCLSCQRWMAYLNERGFRTKLGEESDWAAARSRFKLAPGFRGLHTAVVEGLYVEGPVPAADIHLALKDHERNHIKGLVVPGLPPGAPGVDSALPQPFVVYAVRDFGLMQPYITHEHYVHL
jgi:hypothetical protein